MASTIELKATGLMTSPNSLDTPTSGFLQASNILIRRDGVIEQRRGFKLYGESFGTSTDRVKQLFEYRDRILRHYSNKLQFQNGVNNNGSVNFDTFSGDFSETETGLRVKSIESNGNFYFTTSEGIKKISAKSGSDLSTSSGFITQAGGIKAIDLTGDVVYNKYSQTDFFTQDSAVAYRVLWSTKDANSNLVPGTPSQRVEIYNPMISLMLQDYMYLLEALDAIKSTSLIDGVGLSSSTYINSYKLSSTDSVSTLRNSLISLCTQLDNDILYANDTGAGAPLNISTATIGSGVCQVNFSSGDPTQFLDVGDKIYLAGFSPATGTLDGAQVVSEVNTTYIKFSTAATGAVTIAGTATINSNFFRSITQPSVPSNPATNNDNSDVQTYLSDIIVQLQALKTGTYPAGVIDTTSMTNYIDPLDITTTSTCKLKVTIPEEVTDVYFVQLYRSPLATATGVTVLSDLTPSDEMQLVYEAYPTAGELSAKSMTIVDIVPDLFRGANLYTNEATGEGALQANDLPPFAKDINRFKNYTFYANTKTRQRMSLSLLGVSNIANNDTLTITDGTTTNTYTFVQGVKESRDFTCDSQANTTASGYITVYTANNDKKYYFWMDTTGADVDPSPSGYDVGVKVIITGLSNTQVATKLRDTINIYLDDFTASASGAVVTVLNAGEGIATNSTVTSLGGAWAVTTTIQGAGEDASTNKILLSQQASTAIAVDETARSLIRVVNKNTLEIVYAYYLSGASSVPGKMFFEARSLAGNEFSFTTSGTNVGESFNPDISPSNTETSDNEERVNRVYFSKLQQPEAVPLLNYMDVGASDKKILRIFPLRDTLFVFKEDGLYRISGEISPFTLALFDSSCILIAPDSISVANNLIYGWTTQGIVTISESGVSIISRPIDVDILKLASSQYTNFKTATFGVGYESDNSYIVWTIRNISDTVAKIAYRYSTLTNSWTIFDKTNTCGIILHTDDKLYLGAGDTNYIEQERKEFSRYDYADREFDDVLSAGNYYGTEIQLSNVDEYEIGDSLVQEQTLTNYEFNMLLKKLDNDVLVNDSNYYSSLQATAGNDLRAKIISLAQKLDADTGVSATDYESSIAAVSALSISSSTQASPTVITTASPHGLISDRIITISGHTNSEVNGTHKVTVTSPTQFTIPVNTTTTGTGGTLSTVNNDFRDLKACYNKIIVKLNADPGVGFTNYSENDTQSNLESVIVGVNYNTNKITLNQEVDYVVGAIKIYKAIESSFTYIPNTMGDALGWKQVRQATMMFQSKAFTSAKLAFATDLLPEFKEIEFNGEGNGIFGLGSFGSGFFGGAGSSAPFRTYIPRDCQRCRMIYVKFTHKVARESYAIFGTSLTFEAYSDRAYR